MGACLTFGGCGRTTRKKRKRKKERKKERKGGREEGRKETRKESKKETTTTGCGIHHHCCSACLHPPIINLAFGPCMSPLYLDATKKEKQSLIRESIPPDHNNFRPSRMPRRRRTQNTRYTWPSQPRNTHPPLFFPLNIPYLVDGFGLDVSSGNFRKISAMWSIGAANMPMADSK